MAQTLHLARLKAATVCDPKMDDIDCESVVKIGATFLVVVAEVSDKFLGMFCWLSRSLASSVQVVDVYQSSYAVLAPVCRSADQIPQKG